MSRVEERTAESVDEAGAGDPAAGAPEVADGAADGTAPEGPVAEASDDESPSSDDGSPSSEDPEATSTDPHAEEDDDAEALAGGGPGEALSDEEIERGVAALLFAATDPLSVGRLAKALERPRGARVRAALEALGARLESSGLPIELRAIAGGWQLFTTTDQADIVAGLARARREEKVSPAALETLAVVAYRQPVTKAEIEAIRGVQAGPMLRSLVDRGLVRVTGRADVPGHPLLYGTTRGFLDSFGLGSLKDLPRDGELVRD